MRDSQPFNKREWVLKTLSHEETGTAPFHFDFTSPARKKLTTHFGTDDLTTVLRGMEKRGNRIE